jgi:hypothetical protein
MQSKMTSFVLAASMLTLIACGKESNKSRKQILEPLAREESQVVKGTFRANLRSMNSSVAGSTQGTATFIVKDNQFHVEVKVNGASANTTHVQYVHTGSACPTSLADTNIDGVIDAKEGMTSFGNALLALDGDISSHTLGAEAFPVSNSNGNYYYSEFASLHSLVDELKSMGSLKSGHDLNLAGKQVVIYGVSSNVELPSTVAAPHGTAHASVPVACGEIVRIAEENDTHGKY